MDSRSNLLRSWDATETGSSQAGNSTPSYTFSFDTNHTFTYDAAGRETNDAVRYCSVTASSDPNSPPNQAPILNSPRTYDAENHITAQTVPAYYEPSSTACWTGADPTYLHTEVHNYTWGPDAHLAQMSVNAAQTSTLGWDGDDLLYTASGSGIGIAIEKLGILAANTTGTANTFSIYDRDWSGGLADVHEAGGFSAVNVLSLKIPDCTTIAPRAMPPPPPPPGSIPTPVPAATPTPSATKQPYILSTSHAACGIGNPAAGGGPSAVDFTPMTMGYPSLGALREDGYSDNINTFQGVRAYDSAMNQWTTPDAYSGDVHDPMSQKPYMWNGNNPVEYSDPSGYDPNWAFIDPVVGPAPHMIYDTIQDAKTVADGKAPTWSRVLAGASIIATVSTGGEGRVASKLARFGIEVVSRDGHAISAIASRIASGRVTLRGVVDTYRNGREFFDTARGNYIRYDRTTGTTVVTESRNGRIVTVFDTTKPSSRWNPIP
jgi:hypothetical protein